MQEATFVPDVPILSSVAASEEADDVALLAKALRSITQRLVVLEREQRALDTNMQHIAGALEAIVEAATAKLDIKA